MAKNGFKVDGFRHARLRTGRSMATLYRPQVRRPRAQGSQSVVQRSRHRSRGQDFADSAQSGESRPGEISPGVFEEKYGDAGKRNFDGVSQLQAMDKEGLDVAVLFPTRGLTALASMASIRISPRPSPAPTTTGCTTSPKRIPSACSAVTMVAPHDISGSIEEIRRTVKDYGFRGIFIRPNHVNNKKWSDPYYDPLWAECEKLNYRWDFTKPAGSICHNRLFFHICSTFSMFNTFGFPFANMLACGDMIFGGVMERFPKLKVAFLEGNCSWAPWLLWRMGEYAETTGQAEYPYLKLTPLEYFSTPVLRRGGMRRDHGKAYPRIRPGRQYGLLDRLSTPGC